MKKIINKIKSILPKYVKYRPNCCFINVKKIGCITIVECIKKGKKYNGCLNCKDFDCVVDITPLKPLFKTLISKRLKEMK